jgi:hydrogenase-4 component B
MTPYRQRLRTTATDIVSVLVASAMIAIGIAALFGRMPHLALAPSFPVLGIIHFALTPLGGFFTVIAGIVALPTSFYSGSYLARYAGRYSLGWFTAGYVLLLIAIVGIFAAADVVSFTIAWEVMTLTSCALVAFEWREPGKVRAALVMLGMSEFGTLAALLAFLLAAHAAGSLGFDAIARHSATLPPATQTWIALLSLFGFGVKAGILPFNAWLPRAHPEAPANVSALLSGVILNLGIYGMLLVNLVLVPQSAMLFGIVALAVGSLSAIAGILYATIDDDLKRMLAFSSVENLGIVVAAIGAGAIFFAMNRFQIAALGIGAGLWHMGNHALYKSLLFLGAGAVDEKARTRNANLLGGLAKAMPVTAGCFLVGALAIAAIPPLNGFASEWLALEALLRSAELAPLAFKIGFVLAGALLALTAALAVTCFVKAFAMTFLGAPRSDQARDVNGELSPAAGIGMVLLAIACVVTGIFPAYVAQLIDAILPGALRGQLGYALLPPFLQPNGGYLPHAFVNGFQALGARIGAGAIPGQSLVLMHRGTTANPVVFAMSSTYIVVFAAIALGAIFLFRKFASRKRAARARVWAGGLRPLLPEMNYTATGFSNPVRVIFEAIFHPRSVENTRDTIHEHFRIAMTRRREDVFIADRVATNPLVSGVRAIAAFVARIHHGRLEGYVLYALGALTIVLVAMAL